jgi:hypothetical protein
VKDAHDRYANIEVAYLLQRMELYEGLAILTTNLRQNVDSSLSSPGRTRIRERGSGAQCLPACSHELDHAAFRQVRPIDLTGGHLRPITLRAAFVAAAAGGLIGLPHIAQAVRG